MTFTRTMNIKTSKLDLDFDNTESTSLPSLFDLKAHSLKESETKLSEEARLWEELSAQISQNPESLGVQLKKNTTEQEKGVLKFEPKPGYVVKTSVSKAETDQFPAGLKFLINVCYSDKVPEPPAATEKEIISALNAEQGVTYQIPFMIGSLKKDKDRGGNDYLVCDAALNTKPYKKTTVDSDFKIFVTELAIEHIEEKHGLQLDRNISFPKSRCKGQLEIFTLHFEKKKPSFIKEVSTQSVKAKSSESHRPSPMITEIKEMGTSSPEPAVSFLERKINGKTLAFIFIEIPAMQSISSSTLEIESSRVIFYAPSYYQLDKSLPFTVDISTAKAKFIKSKNRLVVKAEIQASGD
ncbi:hypothetical protein G9A89_015605 [Geosiphon pyriformis]|nr:hypothetical protein G9A89_015605 [Geosiphon pyriformis]